MLRNGIRRKTCYKNRVITELLHLIINPSNIKQLKLISYISQVINIIIIKPGIISIFLIFSGSSFEKICDVVRRFYDQF